MKNKFKFLTLLGLSLILFQSCTEDDAVPAPEISNFEVGALHDHDEEGEDDHDHDDEGHHDEGIAHPGGEMHIGADIIAFAKITSITVDIHGDDVTAEAGEVVWEMEKVYTDAKYLVLNAEFHEHVDVPANAAHGEYHITMTVVDEAGNSTSVDSHFDVEEEDHDHED